MVEEEMRRSMRFFKYWADGWLRTAEWVEKEDAAASAYARR